MPKEQKKPTKEIVMLDAVGEYLTTLGWTPLVASVSRIQGPVDLALNYELVIRFTGAPPQLAMRRA